MMADPRITVAPGCKASRQVARSDPQAWSDSGGSPGMVHRTRPAASCCPTCSLSARRGEPIRLKDARHRPGCATVELRQLVAIGTLSLVPGSQSMFYPADVAEVARSLRRARPPAELTGYIGAEEAARILGLSPNCGGQLATPVGFPRSVTSTDTSGFDRPDSRDAKSLWPPSDRDTLRKHSVRDGHPQ